MRKIPDYIHDEQARKNFAAGVEWPSAWEMSARYLLTAADAIAASISEAEDRTLKRWATDKPSSIARSIEGQEARDIDITHTASVWAMLVGLAFENLLKGIIVAKELPKVSPPAIFTFKEGHKLIRLALRASCTLTQEEKDLLEELTHFIVWRGKYAIPTTQQDLYALGKRSDERPTVLNLAVIAHATETCGLMREKLYVEFRKAQQNWRTNYKMFPS